MLLLTDYGDNKAIASIPIAKHTKNGRALKLDEAHTLMCDDLFFHGGLEAHDPQADVQWTRCLFIKLYAQHKDIINDAVRAKRKRNIPPPWINRIYIIIIIFGIFS